MPEKRRRSRKTHKIACVFVCLLVCVVVRDERTRGRAATVCGAKQMPIYCATHVWPCNYINAGCLATTTTTSAGGAAMQRLIFSNSKAATTHIFQNRIQYTTSCIPLPHAHTHVTVYKYLYLYSPRLLPCISPLCAL